MDQSNFGDIFKLGSKYPVTLKTAKAAMMINIVIEGSKKRNNVTASCRVA